MPLIHKFNYSQRLDGGKNEDLLLQNLRGQGVGRQSVDWEQITYSFVSLPSLSWSHSMTAGRAARELCSENQVRIHLWRQARLRREWKMKWCWFRHQIYACLLTLIDSMAQVCTWPSSFPCIGKAVICKSKWMNNAKKWWRLSLYSQACETDWANTLGLISLSSEKQVICTCWGL